MTTTTRTHRRLTTTAAAAVIALAFLGGAAGGASAAKLITGKQIKDGTVRTADIKNSTIKGLDVKNGTVTDADLADESVGTDELADGGVRLADLAPEAQNVVRSAKNTSSPLVATCNSEFIGGCASLLSLNVGSGTWLVTGTLTVANNSSDDTELESCGLRESITAVTVDKAAFRLFPYETSGSRQTLTFQGVVTTSGIGTLQLKCTEKGSDALVTNDLTITALSVAG